MINIDEIKKTIHEMSYLLQECNLDGWADNLLKIVTTIDQDPEHARYLIMSLYGGMGSLNDIVLCKSGTLLIAENDKFELLKNKLYELCRN